MRDRNRDEIRRHSVLDREQRDEQPSMPNQLRARRRPFKRMLPLLIFALIVFMVLKDEVPIIDEWWQQIVRPQQWAAQETCVQAAITSADRPDFVRVLRRGNYHATEQGGYLDRLVVGQMGESGQEEQIHYSCYLDAGGKLVKINRVAEK